VPGPTFTFRGQLPDEIEFRSASELPLYFFARIQANRGGQGQRDSDEESHGPALRTNGLHFDRVINLHNCRLLYKVAVVKGDFDDEPTAITGATDVL